MVYLLVPGIKCTLFKLVAILQQPFWNMKSLYISSISTYMCTNTFSKRGINDILYQLREQTSKVALQAYKLSPSNSSLIPVSWTALVASFNSFKSRALAGDMMSITISCVLQSYYYESYEFVFLS